MSEMEEIGFKLETSEYDYLIIGSGVEESLYAAYISKVMRQKVLVLDLERVYSNNSRTMNFKEYHQFTKQIHSVNEESKDNLLRKKQIFFGANSNDVIMLNEMFALKVNSTSDFKYFNIDLQPKLLYSTSETVSLMQQADMDQYMDFRAIHHQYYYESSLRYFVTTPTSKSEIFTSKVLSLSEKKNLFQVKQCLFNFNKLLHTLIKIRNRETNYKADQNSTDEFDKDTAIDESTWQKYLSFKDQSAYSFLLTLLSNNISEESKIRLFNILFYSLCFTPGNYHSLKPAHFLKRLVKFIRSVGVHSQSAFLYTNYGTGDIAQGFCRIASVYNADFILHDKLKLGQLQLNQSNYYIQTNLADQPIKIKNGVILSNQIYAQQQDVIKQLRLTLITTKYPEKLPEDLREEVFKFNKNQTLSNLPKPSTPLLYIIPPNCIETNKYPIYIFRVDNAANVTHQNYECFFLKVLIDDENQIESLRETLIQFVQHIDTKHIQCQENASFNYVCYSNGYIQKKGSNEQVFQQSEKLFVCSDENFELDLDDQTISFQENVKILNKDFEEGFYMVSNTHENVKNNIEEPEASGVDKLLQQIDQLKQ